MPSVNRVRQHDKQLQALELRKAGYTFERIADALGYASKQAAFAAVKRAMNATLREAADGIRTLELERLDAMLTGVYAQAMKGNQGAVDRVIRIMERRAKLLGLDAPAKQEVANTINFAVDLGAPDADDPA